MQTDWKTLIAKLAGLLALIAGIFLIILGPAELVCFPWYMEGGRFHYEGFGFGSLVYAVIAGQVIVYPLIGAILATIGYGHIKGHGWAISLVRGLATIWLIVGLPLMPVLLFLTLSFKDLTGPARLVLIPVILGIYPITPLLVRRFYRTEWWRDAFTHSSSKTINDTIIVKVGLIIITGLVLVGTLLLRGLIPVFGIWLHGTMGMIVAIILLFINSLLLVLNLRQSHWAQKTNLGYTLYWLITIVLTSITFDKHMILSLTSFASVEKQAMLNVPVQGVHIALAVLPPLITILILQLGTQKHVP